MHGAWLNSRALEVLGIDESTPDPAGGLILREPESMEPTGILIDNAAYDVLKKIPVYTDEQYETALVWAMHEMKQGGCDQRQGCCGRQLCAENLSKPGPGRAFNPESQYQYHLENGLDRYPGKELENLALRADYATPNVTTSFTKIMLDGIPPTRTSAMLEPYLPDEEHGDSFTGKLIHSPEQLTEDMIYLDGQGQTVKIHATGDRAVRVALDAIEAARKANGDSGLMHEISHAELIHPDDILRFKQLNATAEFSPILWYPSLLVEIMAQVIGAERANQFWPIKSLQDAGAHLIYGSDWPSVVPDPNPWPGIEAMVTRRDPYGVRPGELWPDQAIALEDALRIFTINGAAAGKHADRTGTIEVGKSADFIVLDRNIFQVPAEDISETQVVLTVVSGQEVYNSEH